MGALLAALATLVSLFGAGESIPLQLPPTERSYYEPLEPFTLGSSSVYLSLATTSEARTKGLSGTTELPPDIIKVFVFPASEAWSFWMKDMLYPIDIVWLDEQGKVVHILEAVSPETYPDTFTPPAPAKVVLETAAGGVARYGISFGDTIDLGPFLTMTE